MNKTGIYIAFPTSSELKSIYKKKDYKTKVNNEHTKIGITINGFKARSTGYTDNFDNEVEFIPLVIVESIDLKDIEKKILSNILNEFKRVGRARKWFNTDDRNRIKEIVLETIAVEGKEYEVI